MSDAPTLSSLPHESPRGVVEVLWHQREVELAGVLHRVRVPLVGSTDAAALATELTELLASWWEGRSALSPAVRVTSVLVDVADVDGERELVLMVTTDALAEDHSIVNVRVVRDVRRALRIHRLGVAAPQATSERPLAA